MAAKFELCVSPPHPPSLTQTHRIKRVVCTHAQHHVHQHACDLKYTHDANRHTRTRARAHTHTQTHTHRLSLSHSLSHSLSDSLALALSCRNLIPHLRATGRNIDKTCANILRTACWRQSFGVAQVRRYIYIYASIYVC